MSQPETKPVSVGRSTEWESEDLNKRGIPAEFKLIESVEAVRKELRGAVFNVCFMSGFGKYAGTPEGAKQDDDYKQLACNFVAFGINARLMSIEEGNEWLDAIWGRKVLGDVMLKYE